MCGIVGYYQLGSTRALDYDDPQKILEKAQEKLQHRGPNGYRIWLSPDYSIGLAHRRLSIIDLSSAGYQPMWNANKTIGVCYNGEVYNYKKLRAELESDGYHFSSNCDTEVLIHAYTKWGIHFVEHIEGMFAIAIIDVAKKELFLIRDRIGVKPLYFSLQNDILSFSSEIKALWELPWIQRSINPLGVYHYLTFLASPAPLTIYKGIYKLPAGYYAKVTQEVPISFHQWYTPLAGLETYSAEAYQSEITCIKTLKKLLQESVEKRLISDVPIGAFLSGGVDSSLIVALMSQHTTGLKTFNASFADGQEYSELQWARKVARRFGTQHHEIIISEKEAFEFFEKMVDHHDEPLADCVSIPLYYVSQLAKDMGVSVVLSGEGADELFCGYSLYAQYIDMYYRFWKTTQHYIPAFTKKGLFYCASRFLKQKPAQLDALKNWAENKHFFWGGALSFYELMKKDIIDKTEIFSDPIVSMIYPDFTQNMDSHHVIAHHLEELHKKHSDKDFLTSMTYLELKHRLPELLLMRLDKMTMAASVEAREPFLDHTLLEYAFAMPMKYKLHNNITKYILKKMAESILPHDIIYRKKVGFAAPISRWFKDGTYFKSYFKDMLASTRNEWKNIINIQAVSTLLDTHERSQGEYSVQLWTLQNLMAYHMK